MATISQNITGNIFDIKKYAIHDGPGIRSTVFMKGCPLRCRWCHNPESWSSQPELMFSKIRCVQCGKCVLFCPNQAIHIDVGQCPHTDISRCTICGECAKSCPTQARKIVGRKVTTVDVFVEVMKDAVFYEESNGGVTFSGGEPLMQPEFLKAMLILFRRANLHTAVDTCLYANQSVLDDIMPYSDLFLCDIKHMDPEKHKKWTGVDNSTILSNLEYLAKSGVEIIIRIPVIPDFNDTVDDIENIASFVKSLATVSRINLLPYTSGGVSKGNRLINSRDIVQYEMVSPETMDKLLEIVSHVGFDVKES